jgi:hypothetical protein
MLDRRKGERGSRIVTGVGIGLPVAVIINYAWKLHTHEALPDEVQVALGSLVTWASVCMHDIRFVFLMLFRRLLRRGPNEND